MARRCLRLDNKSIRIAKLATAGDRISLVRAWIRVTAERSLRCANLPEGVDFEVTNHTDGLARRGSLRLG